MTVTQGGSTELIDQLWIQHGGSLLQGKLAEVNLLINPDVWLLFASFFNQLKSIITRIHPVYRKHCPPPGNFIDNRHIAVRMDDEESLSAGERRRKSRCSSSTAGGPTGEKKTLNSLKEEPHTPDLTRRDALDVKENHKQVDELQEDQHKGTDSDAMQRGWSYGGK